MQNELLIAHTDIASIAGQFSSNIEAAQVDPYILEAQTGEIRRFLGDELYLTLLNGFDKDTLAAYYDFALYSGIGFDLSCTGCTTPEEFWNPVTGWDLGLTGGASAIVMTFETIPAATFDGFFDISAYSGGGNYSINITMQELGGSVIDIDSITPAMDTGRKTFQLINPTAQPVTVSISVLQADPVSISTFSLDGLLNEVRFRTLMDGDDYTNLKSELVRFNGLEEVLKYWSCYRYIRSADILMMRFGNRIAEDGIYSSGATREQVKATVYNQKNQALKFQTDADDYINTFIATYPEFNSNVRIPKRASFELNKLPQGSRGHRHFFPTDDHNLNRR